MERKKKEVKELMTICTEMALMDLSGPITRMSIETIITIQVHQAEITRDLKSKDINDFEWQK